MFPVKARARITPKPASRRSKDPAPPKGNATQYLTTATCWQQSLMLTVVSHDRYALTCVMASKSPLLTKYAK